MTALIAAVAAPADQPEAREADFAALYAEVQQFYAHQMQLFDSFLAEAWAGTFTEDAVFDVPTLERPLRGRGELAASVRRNEESARRSGERLRHWLGMIDVTVRPDGTLHTRAYALVYVTTHGGSPKVHRVCVMEDSLVRRRGSLRTSHRLVTRDDLA
ncbi:nuclear transport factor 2 family protein [Streptomyces sp. NPDC004111]|uniref:nuclear transport factor 2 family protein n=1 Tax=Streptomyces sp. NPDC004111 TaxID=3364690 RepID=UPI00368703E8